MLPLNITEQTQAVDKWYSDAKIYLYGTREQQMAAFYRTLGEIAEGIEKIDNLKVSAAIGRSIWTFVGLLHFCKDTKVADFVVPLESAIKQPRQSGQKGTHLNILFTAASGMVGTLLMSDRDVHGYVSDLHALARQYQTVAKSCGLEFDRVVYNGHRALCAIQGEMNGAGLFDKTVNAKHRDTVKESAGHKIPFTAEPPAQPGSYTNMEVAVYLEGLIHEYSRQLFDAYSGALMMPDALETIQTRINDALRSALRSWVMGVVERNHLLQNRQPGVVVTHDRDNVRVSHNPDLTFLIDGLKGL